METKTRKTIKWSIICLIISIFAVSYLQSKAQKERSDDLLSALTEAFDKRIAAVEETSSKNQNSLESIQRNTQQVKDNLQIVPSDVYAEVIVQQDLERTTQSMIEDLMEKLEAKRIDSN